MWAKAFSWMDGRWAMNTHSLAYCLNFNSIKKGEYLCWGGISLINMKESVLIRMYLECWSVGSWDFKLQLVKGAERGRFSSSKDARRTTSHTTAACVLRACTHAKKRFVRIPFQIPLFRLEEFWIFIIGGTYHIFGMIGTETELSWADLILHETGEFRLLYFFHY